MADLRAAVVGAGVFGGYHASKYAGIPGVRLTAVHDIVASRADAVARHYDASACADYDHLLDLADVITIASPANTHFELAQRAIAAGKHVLVEKPIAMRVAEADALIRMARSEGVILQVGHQERYVFDALGALRRETGPREAHSRRCGPFTGRGGEVSVVFDLMIHDLDLLRRVTRGDPVSIKAQSSSSETNHGDETTASLEFADGAKAFLVSSRIAPQRVRDMRLVYDDGEILVDFSNRRIVNSTAEALATSFDSPDAPLALQDPLGFGVRAFVDCVRSGAQPIVTGEDGRDALAWALQIEAAAWPGRERAVS